VLQDAVELKRRYDEFAQSRDHRTTASDFNLRELEIDTAAEYMHDGQRVLDVGCGLGYSLVQYATRNRIEGVGIDYSEQMILGAQELAATVSEPLSGTVEFRHASVLELPFPDEHFDVVTSGRCLMALLDWDLQQRALAEIARVLKPGGVLVLMEGTFQGLDRLNAARAKFNLDPIAADGRERLFTLKFDEEQLLNAIRPYYVCERVQRFGMYYFLTRIVQPLLVAPEAPRYDHPLNDLARRIAGVIPDFEGLGHLAAFILVRR
jgi:ubiquinone/menaquinone biosynthesis C-methylase UbiE